jgi:hypothetical protein
VQSFRRYALAAVLLPAPFAGQALAELEPTPKVLAKRIVGNEPLRSTGVRMPVGVVSDLMVVGTPGDVESGGLAGAAFVFRIDGNDWVQVQKLVPPAPADGYQFGFSLSIEEQIDSGEVWLAVGAPASGSGRVYLYKRNGNTFDFKQLLEGESPGDFFGYSVAINVDIPLNQEAPQWTLAVGAPTYMHDTRLTVTGTVFISARLAGDSWTQPALPIGAADFAPDQPARVGHSVALDGDRFIAGAPNLRVKGQNGAGGAFFGTRGPAGTWTMGPAYENPDALEGQTFGGANFGDTVAMVKQLVPERQPTGNFVYVVGAPETTTEVPGGSAYIIDTGRGGLASPQRLTRPGSPVALDRFGSAIAILQDLIGGDHKILVGHRPDTDRTTGAAYLYDQPDLPEAWVVKRRFILGDTDSAPNNTALPMRAIAAWNSLIAVSAANLATSQDAVFTTEPSIVVTADFE